MDKAGGIHPWTSEFSGSRVFQECAALLADASGAGPGERRIAGEKLRAYVLNPPLPSLGKTGTTLPVPGSGGDYDMTLVACVSLLGLFETDTLALPNDVFLHLIRNVNGLFGQIPEDAFDVGPWRFPETENHLFMTEGSRSITNDVVFRNARHLPALDRLRDSLFSQGVRVDNRRGGLRRLLLKMLSQIIRRGYFEFNARIYQRFTLHALLNLQAFSSDEDIRTGAAIVLDYTSALFALQSCGSIRWGPYRRSSEIYDDSTLFNRDAVASFFAVHSGLIPWSVDPDTGLWSRNSGHAGMALWACLMPYRVPPAILGLLRGDKPRYVAEIRSGTTKAGYRGALTETYSGGKNFLLVGGGPYESHAGANFPTISRGWRNTPWVYDVLNRPAALILYPTDQPLWDLNDLLHVNGSLWKAPSAYVRDGFLIGLGEFDSEGRPLHIPSPWGQPEKLTVAGSTVWSWDKPELGLKIKASWPDMPAGSFWKGKTSRHPVALEAIDTGLRASERAGEWEKLPHQGWHYRSFTGPVFEGQKSSQGWKKIHRDRSRSIPGPPPFCPEGKTNPPHFKAYALADPDQPFVCADGRGHFFAYRAEAEGFVFGNFSLWWHPIRRVFP